MSLIARCPACLTWYKVVPDQLRISDGWVRCGTCSEIFDVSRQLIEAESELPTDPVSMDAQEIPPQSEVAAIAPALHDESTRPSQPAMAEQRPSYGDEAPARPLTNEDIPPGVPAGAQREVPWDSAALLIKPSIETVEIVETEVQAGPQSRDKPEPEPAATEPVAVAPASVPVVEPVSFMRAPAAQPDLNQNGKRLLWAVLSVLLLLGLVVQGLHRERDQLAASKPEFIPALQTFCEALGCRLSPLQRIEALVLDSATFHQVDPETLQLHLVVKNKSQLALALPAVELTLTDLADQPVMRRVFTPVELGATTQTIAATGEWSATANLRVMADTAQARALGYRLLLFYP